MDDTACRIEFLSPEERFRRENYIPESEFSRASGQGLSRFGQSQPLVKPLIEHVENPILFQNNYAVTRFKNTTGKTLQLFVIRSLSPEPWGGGYSPELSSPELPTSRPPLRPQQAFHIDIDLHDAVGNTPELVYVRPLIRSYLSGHPKMPTANVMRDLKLPILTVQQGETVDLQMSILGDFFRRECWLQAGTYTVHSTVSYAEAPSGEITKLTSEPVTVTVTPEHVKAAEEYWKSLESKQK